MIRYPRTIKNLPMRCGVLKIDGKISAQINEGTEVDMIRKILESVCEKQDVGTVSFYVKGAKTFPREVEFTKQYHRWRKQCTEMAEGMSELLAHA